MPDSAGGPGAGAGGWFSAVGVRSEDETQICTRGLGAGLKTQAVTPAVERSSGEPPAGAPRHAKI